MFEVCEIRSIAMIMDLIVYLKGGIREQGREENKNTEEQKEEDQKRNDEVNINAINIAIRRPEENLTSNENLICPICQDIFKDPVMTKGGISYCRECISKWINQRHNDPLTKEHLEIGDLITNYSLKKIVEERNRIPSS